MTYSPASNLGGDVLNDSSYKSLVDRFKGFLRDGGFKPDVVENLVKDNRLVPRFEENERGKYYIDSTGWRHERGGLGDVRILEDGTIGSKDVYKYEDLVTHWLTPEEIEERIEATKPTALKVEESDNVPCDPETVPGGIVSYNVSHTSTTVPDWGDAYEEQESVKLSKVKKPVAAKEPGNRRFQFEQEEQ